LLCFQTKDCLHVRIRMPPSSQYAIHGRSHDPFFKVMIEVPLAFLGEMNESLERKDTTKQDRRATWDGRQVHDVRWRQMSLELCAIKAAIV
jgi:hypothetical protein